MNDKELLEIYNDEPLNEMATVYRDTIDNVCITVNPDPKHIGEPYFKFYNSRNYNKASKCIRISFLEPKYIIHNNTKPLEDWVLNNKEKKSLIFYLNSKSDLFLKELNRNLSVWEKAIYLYNYECGYESNDKEYLPLDLQIPNYQNLTIR